MTNYQKQVKWSGIIKRWVSYQSEYWAIACFFDHDSEHGIVLDEKMNIIRDRLNWLESHPLGAHWRNRNRPGRNRLKYWLIIDAQDDHVCKVCNEITERGGSGMTTRKRNNFVCIPCYNEFREGEYSKFSQITRYKLC